EFGDRITYRCVLGVRHIPWKEVARIDRRDEGKAKLAVTVVRTNGDRLSFSASGQEHERIVGLAKTYMAPASRRRVRLPWWTALGFVAVGSITLALAVYIDYLWVIGEWTRRYVPEGAGVRGKIVMAALPFLTPAAGVMLCLYGIIHLRRRRRQQPDTVLSG